METVNRQRAFSILLLFAYCFAAPVWANCQRAVEIRNRAAANLIIEAEKQIGVKEATGQNDGPQVRRYLKITGLPEGYPWCAAFQAYIHDAAGLPAPNSARVVDWFVQNVVWLQNWGPVKPDVKAGMVGALYYRELGRLGHIVLIVGQDKNNYYTIEGNTNALGSREGQGVWRKIRSKQSIAALADYCLNGKFFIDEYDDYIQKYMK